MVPEESLQERRVLVVEDDPVVSEVLVGYLRKAEFAVTAVGDGLAAIDELEQSRADVIVLDRMLPGIDGSRVCARIREKSDVPILMLTALGSEDDRIHGLEAGADDYIVKPFSPREIVLRVKALLRRSLHDTAPDGDARAGDFRVDGARRIISLAHSDLALTAREFDLLAFFIRHPQQVFDRETLLRRVWGWKVGDESTVTVHVRRLREKIENRPAAPVHLQTVWGVGYSFSGSDESA